MTVQKITADGQVICTWTPDGKPTELQRAVYAPEMLVYAVPREP